MKANAVVFEKVNEVIFRPVEVPEPASEDVVIDVYYSWISVGTEGSFLRGERLGGEEAAAPDSPLPFPHVAGYQKVGIVRAVGDTVSDIKPGDRVFASISKVSEMAFDTGGHVNPAVTHRSQVWLLPDEGPDLLAYAPLVLAQVGYNCGTRAPVTAGDRCLVIGDGLVGQWTAQTLLGRGAEVVVFGRHDERLRHLRDRCAAVNLRTVSEDEAIAQLNDVHVVVDTVGDLSLCHAVMPRMRHNGHLVSAGFYGTDGKIDIQLLRLREITLHTPSGWMPDRMQSTLAAIASGELTTEPLVTHIMPAAEAAEAWRIIRERRQSYLGVVLDWRN